MGRSDDDFEFLLKMRDEGVRPLKRKRASTTAEGAASRSRSDASSAAVSDDDRQLFEEWVSSMGREPGTESEASPASAADGPSAASEGKASPAEQSSAHAGRSSGRKRQTEQTVSAEERALFESWLDNEQPQTEAEAAGDEERAARPSRQTMVRRGEVVAEETCDLHGVKLDELPGVLADFFRRVSSKGLEVVQLIVGRGLHSRDAPVLPGRVAEWLREDPLGVVGEVYRAPHQQGGEGALFVYLRRERAERQRR